MQKGNGSGSGRSPLTAQQLTNAKTGTSWLKGEMTLKRCSTTSCNANLTSSKQQAVSLFHCFCCCIEAARGNTLSNDVTEGWQKHILPLWHRNGSEGQYIEVAVIAWGSSRNMFQLMAVTRSTSSWLTVNQTVAEVHRLPSNCHNDTDDEWH